VASRGTISATVTKRKIKLLAEEEEEASGEGRAGDVEVPL
jgi:hypothetical protein